MIFWGWLPSEIFPLGSVSEYLTLRVFDNQTFCREWFRGCHQCNLEPDLPYGSSCSLQILGQRRCWKQPTNKETVRVYTHTHIYTYIIYIYIYINIYIYIYNVLNRIRTEQHYTVSVSLNKWRTLVSMRCASTSSLKVELERGLLLGFWQMGASETRLC